MSNESPETRRINIDSNLSQALAEQARKILPEPSDDPWLLGTLPPEVAQAYGVDKVDMGLIRRSPELFIIRMSLSDKNGIRQEDLTYHLQMQGNQWVLWEQVDQGKLEKIVEVLKKSGL